MTLIWRLMDTGDTFISPTQKGFIETLVVLPSKFLRTTPTQENRRSHVGAHGNDGAVGVPVFVRSQMFPHAGSFSLQRHF